MSLEQLISIFGYERVCQINTSTQSLTNFISKAYIGYTDISIRVKLVNSIYGCERRARVLSFPETL